VQALSSPRDARQLGIATVFQEVLVAPNRNVEDNVLLGLDGPFRRRVPRAQRSQKANEALARVSDAAFALTAQAGTFELMQQHQITIARALAMQPRLLVLDESTAALDIPARDKLFAAVRALIATGSAAVFISHRLDEVLELSDAVTVLRSGKKVAELGRKELSERRLLGLLNPENAEKGTA
jgi:ribose transport system ATP-binding protein